MRSILAAVAIAGLVALSSCGNQPVPAGTPAVTPTLSVAQAVYIAEGGYIAATRAEAAYVAGQFGTPDQTVVANMRKADNVAYALLVPLRQAAQSGATIAQASVDALTAAVAAFQTINQNAGAK